MIFTYLLTEFTNVYTDVLYSRHMNQTLCRTRVAAMKSIVDQERLRQRMTEWQADGNVKLFFRPYVDVSESDDGSEQTTADDDVDVPVQVGDGQMAFS